MIGIDGEAMRLLHTSRVAPDQRFGMEATVVSMTAPVAPIGMRATCES
jgi:hypothetical protein